MNTKSFQAQSLKELDQSLQEIKETSFQPTLAIVFSAVNHDLNDLGKVFQKHQIDLVGCSSGGEINSCEMIEEGIVIMLMDMKKANYQIIGRDIDTEGKTTYQNAFDIGQEAIGHFDNPALLIFSGGTNIDGDQIIGGLKDGAQKEIPIYGGMGANDLVAKETFAFCSDQVTNNGLMTLILNEDKVKVEGLAVSGWEPVGIVHKITKSKGNIVYEINGKPATDIFNKYFGFTQVDGVDTELKTISGQYPLQIIKESGKNIMRSPLFVDEENHSLILAGGVKEGDEFRFSTSPGFEVIEQTVEEFKELKDHFPNVDALVLISCKGRHTAFGPMMEDELEGISEYWDAPLIGSFCYGEIGKTKNGLCEFHNVTSTLVGFKEL